MLGRDIFIILRKLVWSCKDVFIPGVGRGFFVVVGFLVVVVFLAVVAAGVVVVSSGHVTSGVSPLNAQMIK